MVNAGQATVDNVTETEAPQRCSYDLITSFGTEDENGMIGTANTSTGQ